MTTSVRRTFPAMALGLALVASACSSGGSATVGTDSADPPTTTTTPARGTDRTHDVPSPEDVLQATLASIVADTGVPALGAAAFDGDGMIVHAAAGMRERDGSTPVTPDDVFHIGSNTKAMTAALLARLDQRGGPVGFDTTLGEAFGEAWPLHDGYSAVTLAQLLSHTGGAPTDDELDVDDSIVALPLTEARARGAELVLSTSPAYEPGIENAYSNAGFVVVAAAMEAATGHAWEQLMTTEVFEPLGMDSCGFGPPGTEGGGDQPLGHDEDTGEPVYFDNPALLAPAGGVHCSMADWGRFLVALLNGFNGDNDFLSRASVERLVEPASAPVDGFDGGAALGWLVAEGPQGTTWFHNGSNTAWFSQAAIVPAIDRVVLAVSNEASTGEQATGLAFAALAELDRS